MAQTLTEIKALLAAHGLRPKHRFGQNFLHDGNHMRRILDAAGLSAGDVVLEVGPGTGALTERLLESGARVLAVEIDADLEPLVRERVAAACPGTPFELIVGDVLAGKHELNPEVSGWLQRASASPDQEQPGDFKLIANLPYNVASPLLVNLALLDNKTGATGAPASMSHAVVMLQKEVAGRITAPPGGKDYGPLGIVLQALYHAETAATLSPHCFWPEPKVASAVVALRRRETRLTTDAAAFSGFVHRLFAARRKQLRSILGANTPWPEGVDPTQRPETLSVEQIAALAGLAP